ncbi:MAG: pyruvate:ferredoxin (flavodoxin) oxidoreductase [Clostridia bacterium]|nr:pyruvate:ferredoxin (flavodoxin) oxidoreductase [Clostridia bacterium]
MKKVVDGNTAVAMVAYKFSQVIPIYPITPSSPMAEYCDGNVASGKKNIFGEIPTLIEMQSEGGAAGALHGSLCTGAMSTTFTSSQGLLLMLPNLYKLAGEHLPCVLHVAARSLATHALSIFGDHSDVMATRQTGCLQLCSCSVQQAHDFALIAHVLAYKTSLPVIHFFDGFRTSHEVQKIDIINDEIIKKMLPNNEIEAFKNSRLSADAPYQKGTAQNPDVFFQNREATSSAYVNIHEKLEEILKEFAALTGRTYSAFDLIGSKKPKNVVVCMGSACETIEEILQNDKSIKETSLLNVHLYRPFDYAKFAKILPASVEKVIVLDRTKECGAREPLYQDVVTALSTRPNIKVFGGRYGLGGKEFTPAMVKAVLDNFQTEKDNFTVGIEDDVMNSSLPAQEYALKDKPFQMKFWGLGSDGTVSASKSTIKILGEELDKYVQGYFEYDSKKSGSLTRSHIRVSDTPIKSTYLVQQADIITINNFSFMHRYNCLEGLKENGKVLINTIFNADEVDKVLPDVYKKTLQEKKASLYVINAQKLAEEVGLGNKINMIMQTALFRVANIIPFAEAKEQIEKYIRTTFSKKGKKVVDKNLKVSSMSEERIEKVDVSKFTFRNIELSIKNIDDKFYQTIMSQIEKLKGDDLPVSVFDKAGKIPLGTAEFEKRGFAAHLPMWLPKNCIQCGQCVLACPHNAIRPVLVKGETPEELEFAAAFGMNGYYYRLQVSPEDCTGCGVCAKTCPARDKALIMKMANELLDKEKKNYAIVQTLKSEKETPFSTDLPKGLQFRDCHFAMSGACAGCGETPYIKLATTLFGDRMIIANATGCSSIYGGSFPSCPYLKDENGKGPAWANSLFEDNAEFGLGIKLGTKYNSDKNQSVWIIGGDGWAYDIGYGGLDHVLNGKENVNILVLDTEVYSNTGGQASKSTPRGAMVKFANAGKQTKKKDLVALAIASKNCYVAQVSLGANMNQCIKAFKEAEAFDGPSLIVAYSTCVNHGFDMSETTTEMRKAVECGYWSLLRYNPSTDDLSIDSVSDFEKYDDFVNGESRFSAISELRGEKAKEIITQSKKDAMARLETIKKLAKNDKN